MRNFLFDVMKLKRRPAVTEVCPTEQSWFAVAHGPAGKYDEIITSDCRMGF